MRVAQSHMARRRPRATRYARTRGSDRTGPRRAELVCRRRRGVRGPRNARHCCIINYTVVRDPRPR